MGKELGVLIASTLLVAGAPAGHPGASKSSTLWVEPARHPDRAWPVAGGAAPPAPLRYQIPALGTLSAGPRSPAAPEPCVPRPSHATDRIADLPFGSLLSHSLTILRAPRRALRSGRAP